MRHAVLAATSMIAGAGGAFAQPADLQAYLTQFVAGCAPTHTFQKAFCSAEHHYACTDGSKRVLSSIQNVFVSAEAFDPTGQPQMWVGLDGPGQMTLSAVNDPFDLASLRTTGSETAQFSVDMDVGYFAGQVPASIQATLTGQSVRFHEEDYLTGTLSQRMQMPPQFGTFELDFDIYVSRTQGVMATSLRRMAQGGQQETYPSGLLQVILPGMPGFLDSRGQRDCVSQ